MCIRDSDWIIDLGPEGGQRGGDVVAEGTPEDVAASAGSYTGEVLVPVLGPRRRKPAVRPKARAVTTNGSRPRAKVPAKAVKAAKAVKTAKVAAATKTTRRPTVRAAR